MKSQQQVITDALNEIDAYLDTIYAIIGFVNAYKFELEKLGNTITIFQGRKLYTDEERTQIVTPDLGVVINESNGIIGEVKQSIPLDKSHWPEVFDQLKKYEGIIIGWPTASEKVDEFDIVLLIQQSRSRVLRNFYNDELNENLKLKKQFAIIEFNRADQAKTYFHFRIELGGLSNNKMHTLFDQGMYVPHDIFISKYSKVKISDVAPPIALMLHLIYECVIDALSETNSYKKPTANSTQKVTINVITIKEALKNVYSFKQMQSKVYHTSQPEFPKSEWVKNAFDKLQEIGEGKWIDKSSGDFTYFLTKKKESILSHYINLASSFNVKQGELFDSSS